MIPQPPRAPDIQDSLSSLNLRQLDADGSLPWIEGNVALARFSEDSGFKFNEFLLQLIHTLGEMKQSIDFLTSHAQGVDTFMDAARNELLTLEGFPDQVAPIIEMFEEEKERRRKVKERLESRGFIGMAESIVQTRSEQEEEAKRKESDGELVPT